MKKIVLVLLLVLLTLCGCSSGDTGSNETETDFTSELLEDGVIYVGISPDYPPYESIDESTGEIVGFDVDIMDAIAEMMGLEVVYQSMEFSTIVSAVQTGQVDVGISGFSYDPEKQVAFSDAYYTSSQTILYLASEDYSSVEDFYGLTVAAQLGSTCYDLIVEYTDIEVVTGTDAAVLVEALRTGAYDGVCLDTPVAQNYVAANSEFAMLEAIAEDSYGIITATDNTLLIAEINECLAEFMATEAYEELLVKWGIN